MWHWSGGWDSWLVMGSVMLVHTALAVAIVIWALNWVNADSFRQENVQLKELDSRLSSGEITPNEYLNKREELMQRR